MKRITRHFATMRKAANFQGNLYNKYNSVRLIGFPFVGEDGIYIWEVQ